MRSKLHANFQRKSMLYHLEPGTIILYNAVAVIL